ncbi:hypothetical protein [Halioxenophilus sp. WMMB6]|uniref:hypothetical protein n=1 Tax=Halioxenophilus sp. WMMB6 TaxID=3073815 RepID=UPI00295F0FAC|nr:hypothetical protein [Halioxenophilus sp. WMMB6]
MTDTNPAHFNELETDAALEIMNISVGRACNSLALMTGSEVYLSIPEIAFNYFDSDYLGDMDICSAVSQRFRGDMNGVTMIFFPIDMAQKLMVAFIGSHNTEGIDLEVLERDALLEIGNIILNACIGSMVNLLDCKLNAELPSYHKGDIQQIVRNAGIRGKYTMMLKTHIEISDLDINGHLTMVLDSDSCEKFQALIAAYLQVYLKAKNLN